MKEWIKIVYLCGKPTKQH